MTVTDLFRFTHMFLWFMRICCLFMAYAEYAIDYIIQCGYCLITHIASMR